MSSAAWFVDGAFVYRCWGELRRDDRPDYFAIRQYLEKTYCDTWHRGEIDEAYYFAADPDLPSAGQNAFYAALQYPPPAGPGLRVKLYWLQRREIRWPHSKGGDFVTHPQTGEKYVQTVQKGVDVGLAFHLIRSYTKRGWRKLFLMAGDGDFAEPVRHLVENEDVELILLGGRNSISSDLLPYARVVVYFDEIADQIARPSTQRP